LLSISGIYIIKNKIEAQQAVLPQRVIDN
jgi:hypothetical protein